MQKTFKRLLAVALCVVTLAALMCSAGLTAAAAPGGAVSFSHRNARHNGSGAIYKLEHNMNVLTIDNPAGLGTKPYADGKTYAYCIDREKSWGSFDRIPIVDTDSTGSNLENSAYWNQLRREGKDKLLKELMPHCFPAMSPSELGVSSVDDAYIASQIIVWEVTDGIRNENGVCTNGWMYNKIKGTPAQTAYDRIDAALRGHDTKPSWNESTITLKWNGSRYEATVTDTNGVLAQFKDNYSNVPAGLHIERNGNIVTAYYNQKQIALVGGFVFSSKIPTKAIRNIPGRI